MPMASVSVKGFIMLYSYLVSVVLSVGAYALTSSALFALGVICVMVLVCILQVHDAAGQRGS